MNQNSPEVSVAMCTYNGERYLQQQLDSIAAQTLLPTELVVCDDGSTDRTVALLESFRAVAPFRVRILVNAENLGATRNFDQALHVCSGEFIALCDQDDCWFPKKLETLLSRLQSAPEAGGIFSNATLMDGESHPTGTSLWEGLGFTLNGVSGFASDPIGTLLKHDVVTGATLLIRASVLTMYDRIPASWVHDGWLTWVIALNSRIISVDEPLIFYRIHSSQQLGLGKKAFSARVREIRKLERERYIRVASQFRDMLHYLHQRSVGSETLMQNLEKKCAFLERRATLSSNIVVRALEIVAGQSKYHRYARGFRSMRKDLMLGKA